MPETHPLIAALKARREEYDTTQADVARRTSLSKTTICELERGGHQPKLASAEAYATAVGLNVGILGGDTDAQALFNVLIAHRPLAHGKHYCVCGWSPEQDFVHADHVIGLWQLELSKVADARRNATPAQVQP